MSAPVTRNSETEGNPSLKRSGWYSEEAGHLHNRTLKIRMQAKPISSHNMPIMLWLQPYPVTLKTSNSPSTINTSPRWKGKIQPHHSQHPHWWLLKRACAAQSMQHGYLKANKYSGDILWIGNLNSSINSYTKCTPAPQIPIHALWGHHSWQSLSTPEKYTIFERATWIRIA